MSMIDLRIKLQGLEMLTMFNGSPSSDMDVYQQRRMPLGLTSNASRIFQDEEIKVKLVQ